MKTLPNGLVVFNATPHPCTFLCGDEVVVVIETDAVISASVSETEVDRIVSLTAVDEITLATLVTPTFEPTLEGEDIIGAAKAAGADVIVGSIIAAQAYPGRVLAMTPAPGFERVPPAEKRMRSDTFTTF
jgi:(2Fe-2S) ferredoxin